MKRTRSMTQQEQMVRPGMKRDHTVIIIDEEDQESPAKKAKISQRTTTRNKMQSTDTAPFIPTLQRKATSVVHDDIVTSAVELESGSHFGRMSSLDAPTLSKHMKVTQVPKSVLKKSPSIAAAVVSHLKDIAPHAPSTTQTSSSEESSVGLAYRRTATMERRDQRTALLMSNIIPQLPQLPQQPAVEVVFSFDTTGSMYGSLVAVRSKLKQMIWDLQTEIPGIRIGIIAHGDYYDADKYILKWINFGASLQEIQQFVQNVEQTHGGDEDECYELVLKTVQHVFSWLPDTSKALVMIGDAAPHEPGYIPGYSINWREDCLRLKAMGVKIYSLQVGNDIIPFYQQIASMTGGEHFQLSDFQSLHNILLSVCHRAYGSLQRFQERNKETLQKLSLSKESVLISKMFDRTAVPMQKPTTLTKKKTVRIRDPRLAPRQQDRAFVTQNAPSVQLRRSASGRILQRASNKVAERPKETPTQITKVKLTRTKSGRLINQNQSHNATVSDTAIDVSPLARFKLTRTRSGRLTSQKPETTGYKTQLEKLKLTRTRSGRLTYQNQAQNAALCEKTKQMMSPLARFKLTRTRSGRLIGDKNAGYKTQLEKLKLTRTGSGRLISTSTQTVEASTSGKSANLKVERKKVKKVTKKKSDQFVSNSSNTKKKTIPKKKKVTKTKPDRLVSNSTNITKKTILEEKKKNSTSVTTVLPKQSGKKKFMKKKRENVASWDFFLRVPNVLTKVSEWKVLIKPEEKKSSKSLKMKTWKKEAWSGGLCYQNVFKQRDLQEPALYEIAVQDGKKFNVVYWRVVTSIPRGSNVYTCLLGHKEIRSKIKANIQKGNVIHIKQYLIRNYEKNEATLKASLSGNFYYAWVNKGREV